MMKNGFKNEKIPKCIGKIKKYKNDMNKQGLMTMANNATSSL